MPVKIVFEDGEEVAIESVSFTTNTYNGTQTHSVTIQGEGGERAFGLLLAVVKTQKWVKGNVVESFGRKTARYTKPRGGDLEALRKANKGLRI